MVGPFRGLAGGLTRDHDSLAVMFSVLILLMAGAYALLVAAGRHVPLRWAVGAIVATHVVFVLGPPLLLTDVFNYLDYARMGTLHGLNPFTAVPGDAGGDPTYHYATWHHLSSPYGPLFTLFTYALVPLDFKPGYWTLKLLLMAASLGSLYLVWRTALRLRRPAVPALVFVAFNPLLLVFGLGGFHNDFLIMLAVLAGILLLINARPASGAAAMVVAAGMKATAVVIVPFAVLGSSDRRRALLGAIVPGAALVAVSLAVFGTVVPSLGPQTTLVSPLGALNLLGLVLGFGGATAGMQVIAPIVFAGVLALPAVADLARRGLDGHGGVGRVRPAALAVVGGAVVRDVAAAAGRAERLAIAQARDAGGDGAAVRHLAARHRAVPGERRRLVPGPHEAGQTALRRHPALPQVSREATP